MTNKTHTVPSRWERRKERTHQRLLEEAERLFVAKGFDAVTVEEIAGAADVAKGTFFNYFENKECLLGELLYNRMQVWLAAPPAPEAPANERISLLLQTLWEELKPYRHLALHMFLHTIAHPHPDYLPPERLTASTVLAGLIREGQAQGVFRPDINPELAAGLLATYFFRMCVIETTQTTETTETTDGTTDKTTDRTTDRTTDGTTDRTTETTDRTTDGTTDGVTACSSDFIREGLDLLYRGILR
ncbi:MAG TPA: TetR/AcrR family transcriptional regulator [Anaerolineae bacterium]|nr:TetR/AcrR family transcriptional regulator [Anaerolineae bacterium]HQK14188.1 TetR/AcrR family transcriptional regulator [Anaerolineae bacterium]